MRRATAVARTTIALAASLALALALVPAASFVNTQEAQAASVSIKIANANTGKVALKQGSSYALKAKASTGKLSYKSSKKSVVAVSSGGKLKAKKAGKATITVTSKKSKKVKKKVTVTVLKKSKYKAVKSLSASASDTYPTVGTSVKITTTFNPSSASNKNLVYTSSNSRVLAVSSTGTVKAKSKGTAKVTVQSCAAKKAKATISFTVSTAASAPLALRANYANKTVYKTGVKEIASSNWSAQGASGATVKKSAATPAVGDVLVLKAASGSVDGRALKVTSVSSKDNSNWLVQGSTPDLGSVYQTLDVETPSSESSVVAFKPDSDITVVSSSLKSARLSDAASGTAAGKPFVLKFSNKDGSASATLTVTPSVDVKVDFGFLSLKELYCAANLNEKFTVNFTGSKSFSKKIGEVTIATEVPGLTVGLSLTANFSASGSMTLSYECTQTSGIHYKGGSWSKVNKNVAKPSLEIKTSVSAGLTATAAIEAFKIDIADASIGGTFMFTAHTVNRSTSMICTDLDLTFTLTVGIGSGNSLMGKVGLTWSDSLIRQKIWGGHIENGKLVSSCTWKAPKASKGSGGGSSGSSKPSVEIKPFV